MQRLPFLIVGKPGGVGAPNHFQLAIGKIADPNKKCKYVYFCIFKTIKNRVHFT